jgi:ribosomal protein S18 acetylase RimI-like enzyme
MLSMQSAEVAALTSSRADDAVAVLCDAFRDYPVMRYVLGPADDYAQRLRTLTDFFVAARFLRNEPVLGIHDADGRLTAAALVSYSDRPAPDTLAARRERAWAELGAAERQRYEALGEASAQFVLGAPHLHLNMIGVRRSHQRRGLARKLLEAVHRLSEADTHSSGVSLNTETPENVPLYQHFGYRLLGHARVGDELETWALYRPDTAG